MPFKRPPRLLPARDGDPTSRHLLPSPFLSRRLIIYDGRAAGRCGLATVRGVPVRAFAAAGTDRRHIRGRVRGLRPRRDAAACCGRKGKPGPLCFWHPWSGPESRRFYL